MRLTAAERTTKRPTQAEALFLLENGSRMDQKTFHALYLRTPEGFKAELIGGIVYVMSSPTSPRHGRTHARVIHWLSLYADDTPGTEVLDNTTHVLDAESEPEPDACLLVLPQYGGQATVVDEQAVTGASELVVEVANSSRAIDLGAKKRDYERTGVKEYVVALVKERSVVWFGRADDGFVERPVGDDGVFRSAHFPGLWLDPKGLFVAGRRPLVAAVRQGLTTPEHAAFVAGLVARRKAKAKSKKSKRKTKKPE